MTTEQIEYLFWIDNRRSDIDQKEDRLNKICNFLLQRVELTNEELKEIEYKKSLKLKLKNL